MRKQMEALAGTISTEQAVEYTDLVHWGSTQHLTVLADAGTHLAIESTTGGDLTAGQAEEMRKPGKFSAVVLHCLNGKVLFGRNHSSRWTLVDRQFRELAHPLQWRPPQIAKSVLCQGRGSSCLGITTFMWIQITGRGLFVCFFSVLFCFSLLRKHPHTHILTAVGYNREEAGLSDRISTFPSLTNSRKECCLH